MTAALAVSGLPTDRFCFEGFPPRKAGERARRFAELSAEPRTLVFFEAGNRTGVTLGELAAAFGPGRRAVVCRELTKTHEEIRRGTLAELAGWAEGGLLGEVTLVVGGDPGGPRLTLAEAVAEVARRAGDGQPRSEAIAAVARESGLRRRSCTPPWWPPGSPVPPARTRRPGRRAGDPAGARNPFRTGPGLPLGWTHVRDDPSHPDRARLAVRQRAPPHRPCLRLRRAVRHVQPVPADGGEPGADGQRHRRARHPDPGGRRRRGR